MPIRESEGSTHPTPRKDKNPRPTAERSVLPVYPAGLTRNLVICILALGLLGMAGQVAELRLGASRSGFVRLVDLNAESNIPTYFQVGLLWFAAMLLFGVWAQARKTAARGAMQWALMGAVFVYLGLDDGFRLHEEYGVAIAKQITPGSVRRELGFGWLAVGLPVAAAVAIWFLPFVLKLPRRTMSMILTSGVLYLGGAVGAEHFAGQHMRDHGKDLMFSVWSHLEEMMEMGGVVLLVHAVMTYARDHVAGSEIPFLFKWRMRFVGQTKPTVATGDESESTATAGLLTKA